MPSQIKTKGNTRGKSDARMAVVKWARQNGAVHIKVDGIEVVFPPNLEPVPHLAALSPEDVVRRASTEPEFAANAPNPIVSQHPDEYSEEADRWANFIPMAHRG